MKKLKLRIAKFDRRLVVEQLERDGEFKDSENVRIDGDTCLGKDWIDLPESCKFRSADWRIFPDNQERDEYVASFTKWITEEQFGGSGKLEIGKPCLVRDREYEEWAEHFYAGKVAKQLGEEKCYLAKANLENDHFCRWRFAKPLNSVQPTIDGEIYTWEVE